MKHVWLDHECEPCGGMGMQLPAARPVPDDVELELCSTCHGYGRVPEKKTTPGFYGLVYGMALSEGWAWRTRAACQSAIEVMYG